ncbi:MAG: right-handed parallel beta-helix repeat-containing protein [Spirochaetales bacterium]|nr:right-handed parallel beta-helix repeat-containing protein [Spirochaetales bacterium]
MVRKLMRMLLAVLIILTAVSCETPGTFMTEGVYYIDSSSGSDGGSGLTPDSAWRSLDKLNNAVFAPGSSVLFKSGQIFRGSLKPSSGTSSKPVTYSSYGGDARPIIQNSLDLGNSSDWIDNGGGIWKASDAFSFDVGNIVFEHGSCAVRKWSLADLSADGDYYFDTFWKILHLKSTLNPGDRYSSVEAALTAHVIDQSNLTYAQFSNLHIRYGGAHGFGGGGTQGLIIRDCEISFMGGGFLYYNNGEPVRYGNGVEFWGDASDNTVEDCYIHDIYDTGVTNQNHTTSAVQENITYRNNIIENCALASFEFWNRPGTSVMSSVVFENNTSVNPGGGWGAQRPDLHGSHVSVFGNEAVLDNVVIRNNIFYGGNMIYFFDQGVWDSPEVRSDYNCLHPVADGDYDYLCVIWDNNSIDSSVKYGAGNLAELRSASGREANSIVADPQFAALEYPYTLSDGSPCQGLGASGY